MSKKNITFIVNPFSGNSSKTNLEEVIKSNLDLNIYNYKIAPTQYAGHATELSKIAAEQGSDVVVAVGGDGSVNEVAQSLLHTNTILAVLPGGSGNGFAMHLGLGRNIVKAIKTINTGTVKIIDTCIVNGRFFINVAGIGFDARIAYMTKQNSKRGFIPYFKTTLREAKSFKPVLLEIEIDGDKKVGEYAMAAVANATMFGYYFTIAPTARLDDGLLDLVLIKKASIWKYITSAYRFLNKTLDKSNLSEFYQGKHIKIKLLQNDYFHVDGEGMIAEKEMEFKIVPQSLRVLVPV